MRSSPWRRRARPALPCPLLLLSAALLLSAPRLGSALAANFDGQAMQAVSLTDSAWSGFSSPNGTTVEAWVKFNNPNVRWSTIINYSTLTPLSKVGSSKALAFDVGTFAGNTAMSWQRDGELAVCFQCGTSFTDGNWHHLVSSVDYTTGDTAYYVNGTLLAVTPGFMAPDEFRSVPRGGGSLILGMGIGPSMDGDGGVVANQLSTHSLDDIRVHNRVLSAEEVADGAWRLPSDMPDTYRASLMLHWSFEDPDTVVELDLSGHQAHGLRGAVDNVVGVNITYRSEGVLTISSPAMVQGLLQDTVLSPMNTTMFAPGPQMENEIPLIPADTNSTVVVSSLDETAGKLLWLDPTTNSAASLLAGQLLEPGGQLFFQSPDAWPVNDSTSAVDLSYTLSGQQLSLKIMRPPVCAAPDRSFSGTQATYMLLTLGNLCGDGATVQTKILTPPSRGKLFQFLPFMQLWPLFQPLEPQSIGEEIVSFPFPVGNPLGAFVFIDPDLSPVTNYDVRMEYAWLSPSASASPANVTIQLEYISRPPELQEVSFTPLGAGDQLMVQLKSISNSWSISGGAGSTNHRIQRAPVLGSLHQLLDDNQSSGEQIAGFGDTTVLLKEYANEVPPYSPEWGPAVSSNGGYCPKCCTYKATCNPQDCAAVGHTDWNMCLLDVSVENLLGPPISGFPNVDTNSLYVTTWYPCTNCGEQFFVVGFPRPAYVTSVEIAEISGVGSVIGISMAAEYAGNRTEWVSVWTGPPQPVPDKPRTFQPAICPAVGLLTKWVRVDFQTDNSPAIERFTSVTLLGTAEDRTDVVLNAEGRLVYRPAPGISLMEGAQLADSFEVVVSDCSADASPPETVVIPLEDWRAAASAVGDSFFGTVQQVAAVVGTQAAVAFSLLEAAAHLSAAYGTTVQPEEFQVALMPCPCFDISSSDSSKTIKSGVDTNAEGFTPLTCSELDLSATLGEPLALSAGPYFLLQPVHQSLQAHNLTATATARNVTYTLRLQVTVMCPANASIFECADGPEVCATEHYTAVSFDPIQRACVDNGILSQAPASIAIKLVGAVLGTFVVICAVLLCLFLRFKGHARHLLGRGSPPGKGEMLTLVITDIQGSTTLWDSFPDQMAKDIAVHHNILRRALSRFHGYEVATEGDSFKCAFSTAEDALLWSMVVQMELLDAPWTPELEDGGASVLSSKLDWADEHGESLLPPHCGGIMNDLVQRAGNFKSVAAAKKSHMKGSRRWATRLKSIKSALRMRKSHRNQMPTFRGMRVRMGIHTGVATVVHTHENTHRVVYGGKVAKVTKAVSDIPCGGQIIITGQTMAAISSVTALAEKAEEVFSKWCGSGDGGSPGFAIMHLGSHIISNSPAVTASDSRGRLESGQGLDSAMPTESDLDDAPANHLLMRGGILSPIRGANRVLPMGFSAALDELQAASRNASLSASRDHTSVAVPEVEADEEEALDLTQPHAITETQESLAKTSELLMVVPLPIWQRALFYPPPSSVSQLSPAWHEAPKRSNVTILFSFIDGWEMIKQFDESTNGRVAKKALKQHNAVVRTLLVLHKGYEMEGEDGGFVCAFHSPLDALEFSMELQTSLIRVPWQDELLDLPMAQPMLGCDGNLIFRGLRLRVGMCSGEAARLQISHRTGRIEYFGPIMNHAARVAVAAKGGQVLLHEASWTHLVEHSSEEVEAKDSIRFVPMGEHPLKGITHPVGITLAVPAELQDREAIDLRQPSRRQASMAVPVGMTRFLADNLTKSHKSIFGMLPI